MTAVNKAVIRFVIDSRLVLSGDVWWDSLRVYNISHKTEFHSLRM